MGNSSNLLIRKVKKVNELVTNTTQLADSTHFEYYIRDAQGNIMAIYERKFAEILDTIRESFVLSELDMYGSKRLGILNIDTTLQKTDYAGPIFYGIDSVNTLNKIVTYYQGSLNPNYYYRYLGTKSYELSNHLGNVLTTVSDRKIDSVWSSGLVHLYMSDIRSATDYYAFGWEKLGKNISWDNYRNGFGGHEKIKEVLGTADMGDRWLDSRLGRTPKTDAKASMYPGVSPYVYAMNSPANAIDPDGKVVIFINGYPGFGACCGGNQDYWNGWDKDAMKQIGDYHSRYYDGANTWNQGGSNLFSQNRREAGLTMATIQAKDIVNKLERDVNGVITESVKIVTHSMGAAYGRGFVDGLNKYVSDFNAQVNLHNKTEDERIEYYKNTDHPYTPQYRNDKIEGFQIEQVTDIAAFQGQSIPAPITTKTKYSFMSGDADGVANKKGFFNLGAWSQTSDIKNAESLPTPKGAGHGIWSFPIEKLKPGQNNPAKGNTPDRKPDYQEKPSNTK